MDYKLPSEVEQAIEKDPLQQLQTTGVSGRVFHILSDDCFKEIVEGNTKFALQQGLIDLEAGRTENWDANDVKKRLAKRLTDKHSS